MPSGMPCQNSIEQMPATLKISEKAMKYHFLPRKSILGLRKNSTLLKPFFVRVGAGALTRLARPSRASFPTLPQCRAMLDRTGEGARPQMAYLNAQRFAHPLAAQHPVKDHT